jgi:hypothetical protein
MMQISNYSMAIQKLIAGVCSLMLIACTQSDPAPATSGITTTPNEISTAQLEMIGGSEVSTGCGSEIESALFADADKLKKLARTNAGFGMRSTASAAHNNAIDWAESNLKRMRGFNIQSDSYTIDRWEPTPRASGQPGRDLVKAGSLQVRNASGAAQTLSVAGAVPYSLPNEGKGQTAPLVYIPGDTAITAANSKGKVVVRDVGSSPLPYAAFLALAYHISPDLIGRMAGSYDRPYLFTDGPMAQEIVDAGQAGAVGMVLVFNLPTEQISGYFDPHRGTHFVLPAVFVGVDEGEQLKKLAMEGGSASVGIEACRVGHQMRNTTLDAIHVRLNARLNIEWARAGCNGRCLPAGVYDHIAFFHGVHDEFVHACVTGEFKVAMCNNDQWCGCRFRVAGFEHEPRVCSGTTGAFNNLTVFVIAAARATQCLGGLGNQSAWL